MGDLAGYQYVLIALIFLWSGFVRSGLGFGGAVLSLPFLLMIDNKPLVYLPIIAGHLLFFSCLVWLESAYKNRRNDAAVSLGIDWPYLKKILAIMIIPKMIGVLGLITLPNEVMSAIIFTIVSVYAFSYILNKPFKSPNPKLNWLFLILGAYISGTSLIGAPLIIAVVATQVPKEKLRDTLFALWFILVAIKMVAFVYAGIDLQLIHHLWLLPAAGIGHFIGIKFHHYLINAQQSIFYRVLGCVLLVTSLAGLISGFA